MVVLAVRTGFAVTDEDDFSRFHVDAAGLPADEFEELVRRTDAVVRHEDAGHFWISVRFLREQLGTARHPARARELGRMLAHAGARGWLNGEGTHVAAHVENHR
jgi:hypothetical protein